MGIGFGLEESREERVKPHQAWLEKTLKYYGDEVATGLREPMLTEVKALERRVEDSAIERDKFYRDNSEIFKGVAGVGLSVDDDNDRDEEDEGRVVKDLDGGLIGNPKVSSWIDKVQKMTSPGRTYKAPAEKGPMTPESGKVLVPKRGGGGSPKHMEFLERVGGLLGENLSPKRRGRCDERSEEGGVRFSKMTVDLPSEDDEDGSIRSLMTEEAFSPRTSYGGASKSVMSSKNFSFSRSIMNSSVESSLSLESGTWVNKRGGVVVARDSRKEAYYASRLDESFEGGGARIKHKGGDSKVKLERGARADQSRWEKLYEEAGEDGDEDYSSDED